MSAVVHFLAKVSDDPVVLCNGVLQGQFIDGYDVPVFTRRLCRPCDHAETLCYIIHDDLCLTRHTCPQFQLRWPCLRVLYSN